YNDATNGIDKWTTKTATKFATTSLTAAEFTAISSESALTTAASGASTSTSTKAASLQNGQVFAFKTDAGKLGLAHVQAVSGTAATSGSITLNVKIQK
ncbi:MAG TPA: hypothetical protein VF691_03850, partial [Cytophagaceae bacterium]